MLIFTADIPSYDPFPLFLSSLAMSSYSFKSSLKLSQWALLAPELKSFFPFETSGPNLLSSGLVAYKPTYDKKPQNPLVASVLKPVFHLHDFLISCPIILWQLATGRTEENTACASYLLTSCPKALKSHLVVCSLLQYPAFRLHQYPPGKTVAGNNQWVIPSCRLSWWCLTYLDSGR